MQAALEQLAADPEAAHAAAQAFARLKPMCSQLLFARADPQRLAAALGELAAALASVDARGLRRCHDYVMYPLSFMLESIAAARAPASSSTSGGGSGAPGGSISIPAVKNDRAAEAVLDCVLVLQRRAPGVEQDQAAALLQRLVPLLQLPQQAATEEVHPAQAHAFKMCSQLMRAAVLADAGLALTRACAAVCCCAAGPSQSAAAHGGSAAAAARAARHAAAAAATGRRAPCRHHHQLQPGSCRGRSGCRRPRQQGGATCSCAGAAGGCACVGAGAAAGVLSARPCRRACEAAAGSRCGTVGTAATS